MASPLHVWVVREDSGGQHYLQWRGSINDAGTDEFSKYNCQIAEQMILDRYSKMILDGNSYSIRFELEVNYTDDL